MTEAISKHAIAWTQKILPAIALQKDGESHKSLAELQKAQEFAQNRFGPAHEITAIGTVYKGTLCLAQGDTKRAHAEFRAARQSADLLLDEDAQQLLSFTSIAGLATIDLIDSKFEEAELFFEKNLAIYEANPLLQRVDNGAFLIATGEMFFKVKKYREAGVIYDRVISLMTEGTIPSDEGVLSAAKAKRGIIYFMDGNDRDARTVMEEALNAFDSKNITPQPVMAACACAVATLFAKQGNSGSAYIYFEWGLELMSGIYPEKAPILAESLNYMAHYCMLEKDLEKAKPVLVQALKNLDPLLQSDQVLWTLDHLMTIADADEHPDEHKAYKQRFSMIYSEAYDAEWQSTAEPESELTEDQLRYKEDMAELNKRYSRDMHPQVQSFLDHVASEYCVESISSFVEFFVKSVVKQYGSPERTGVDGENPLRSGTVSALPGYEGVFELAATYLDDQRPDEALKILEETLVIVENTKGLEHPDLIPVLEAIAFAHDALGRLADAADARQRIQTIQIISL